MNKKKSHLLHFFVDNMSSEEIKRLEIDLATNYPLVNTVFENISDLYNEKDIVLAKFQEDTLILIMEDKKLAKDIEEIMPKEFTYGKKDYTLDTRRQSNILSFSAEEK